LKVIELKHIDTILFAGLFIWNLTTFILMGVDKQKAVKNKWRISEKSLFLCAFVMGGIGVLTGMELFRHKTKHLSFRILIPLAVITNMVVFYILFRNIKTAGF
jgi:uncharacterized membrane protein YsdA (DUF1294 family)